MKDETIIKNEWTKHFNLTAISSCKFYKIAGCFVIGFEIIKKYGLLQPVFILNPLWKETIKECYSWTYIMHRIKNTNGLGYQITISQMIECKETLFSDAENYMCFNLLEDIHKRDILRLVDQIWEEKNLSKQVLMTELKVYLATYLNDVELLKETVYSIDSLRVDMDYQWFKNCFGEYDKWKENLISVFSNRQAVLDKIEENIENSKIKERVELLP